MPRHFLSLAIAGLLAVFLPDASAQSPAAKDALAEGKKKFAAKDHRGAIEAYTRAIEADPAQPKLERPYNERGRARLALGELDAARADFLKAAEINPRYVYPHYNLALIHGKKDEQAQSVEHADRAVAIDPNYKWTYLTRGYAYVRLKQYDRALADFTEAIRLDEKWIDAYVYRGSVRSEFLKQYDKAVADFDAALRIDPKSAEAYFGRATALRSAGRLREAVADLDRLNELRPNDIQALVGRATVLAESLQFDAAAKDYAKVIELQPTHGLAYYDRGRMHLRGLRYEKAIDDFTAALRLGTNGPVPGATQIRRGEAYFALGTPTNDADLLTKADRDFQAALAAGAKAHEPAVARAIVHQRHSRAEQMAAELEQVLKADPTHAWARVSLAMAHLNLRRYKEAEQGAAKALTLPDAGPDAYYVRAAARLMQRQVDAAIPDVNRYVEANPNNQTGYLLRAEVHLMAERPADAWKDADTAVRLLGPGSKDGLLLRARAAVQLGKFAEADADVRRASGSESPPKMLHGAAAKGDLALARKLVDSGDAKIDAAGPGGATPLHLACAGGHADVARLLLDKRADVHARSEAGWTALHFAVAGGSAAVVDLLLERVAEPNARCFTESRGLGREQRGFTPLHLACAEGRLELAAALVKRGGDLTVLAELGSAPVLEALRRGSPTVTPAQLLKLFGYVPSWFGDDDVAATLRADRGKLTPERLLVAAAAAPNPAWLDTALKDARSPNVRDAGGKTPLCTAAGAGNVSAVRRLLAAGAKTDFADGEGLTPLHYACKATTPLAAKALLAAGADRTAKSKAGETPIELLRSRGFVETKPEDLESALDRWLAADLDRLLREAASLQEEARRAAAKRRDAEQDMAMALAIAGGGSPRFHTDWGTGETKRIDGVWQGMHYRDRDPNHPAFDPGLSPMDLAKMREHFAGGLPGGGSLEAGAAARLASAAVRLADAGYGEGDPRADEVRRRARQVAPSAVAD
jgi:tetratricopeptide (TPR) repeat protein